MGFLQTSDDIASNVIKTTSDVLNSKFTQFITGSSTPVLVTYYHIDETTSTADNGTETFDKVLGKNSPFRYNKIENFPIYGLKELIPTKEEIDMGLMDMSLDGEVIILPNTIKPNAYDYFVYRMDNIDTFLTFRINDFEFSTVKSNSYYKLDISIKDINDSDTLDKLEKQVSSYMTAVIDNIGTQDKCIIEKDVYKDIQSIEKIIHYLMEQYVDTFWNKKYNSFIYKPESSEYMIYDPYITEFIKKNSLVDLQDNVYIVLVNYDTRPDMRGSYNKSIYRNIENQDITKLFNMIRCPITFPTKDTNPFYYYGEETPFTLELEPDILGKNDKDELFYVPKELIRRIKGNQIILAGETPIIDEEDYNEDDDGLIENVSTENEPSNQIEDIFEEPVGTNLRVYWNLIITYLNKSNCFHLLEDSDITLEDLTTLEIEKNQENYIYLPIIVYIMGKYLKFLMNNK